MDAGSGEDDCRIVSRVNSAHKTVMSRKSDPRTGLNQILEMQDLASESTSLSSHEILEEPDSPTSIPSPWCLPPFGAAVPAFNEVSSRIAETASLFGRHIAGFVDDGLQKDQRMDENETYESTAEEREPLIIRNAESTTQDGLDTAEQEITVVTSPTALVPASSQNEAAIVSPNFGAVSLFNATSAAMMGMTQTLITGPPAVWQGLVSRVQTTLRGSADDIGWLQKDETLPPVVDKTERFLELLGRISHGVHVLPNTFVYLLIPGLFSNHGPMYFIDTKKYFSKLGLACYIAKIHSEAGVETNSRELKEHIEELYWGTGKRVLLLGHSKGGVDAAAACAKYWSDLKDKVAGLVFAQSPYGGSPIASDILREGQIADIETRRLLEVVVTKVIKGHMQSLEDLTYDKRREFVAAHPLPPELLTVSFHTEASRAVRVLSTMSHIAHAELPWLPVGGRAAGTSEDSESGKVPVVIPLAAAMALCALHLDLRYGEKSDGLVARRDAEVPGSIVVRPEKKLDHGWMVYSPSRTNPRDPNAAQMCEALLTLLLEEESARQSPSGQSEEPLTDESSNPQISTGMPSADIEEGKKYLDEL